MDDILKLDEDRQLVFGWASVAYDAEGRLVIDKQDDAIPDLADLEDAAYDFVLHSRQGDSMHDQIVKSTVVESIVFTREKLAKMGLPTEGVPLGWWVGFKVEDPDTWRAVRRGDLTAFSVGGSGVREKMVT